MGSWDPPHPRFTLGRTSTCVSGGCTGGIPTCQSLAERSQGSSLPDLTTILQQIHSKLRFEFETGKSYFSMIGPKHLMVNVYIKIIYLIYEVMFKNTQVS